MGIKVFYHAHCRDGFTACWAAWKHFGDTAEYIPAAYGSKHAPRVDEGDEVYLLDFTYKRPVIDTMLEKLGEAGSLRILDHHASAEKILGDLDCATFNMDKSGARLAWEHFHPGKVVPNLVIYVEDRDLWRFKKEDSHAINAFISTAEQTFEQWDQLNVEMVIEFSKGSNRAMTTAGEAVLRHIEHSVDAAVSSAHMEIVDGHEVPCVNSSVYQSEIGARLNDMYPDAKFSLIYFDKKDGQRGCSLRTQRDDFDVSEVAKKYGGGGHPTAAGFASLGPQAMMQEAEQLVQQGNIAIQKLMAYTKAIEQINDEGRRVEHGPSGKKAFMIDELKWQHLLLANEKLKEQLGVEDGDNGQNIILMPGQ